MLGDEWKTMFQMWYESYKWVVMPFSLTNASVAFQCFVNAIFINMLDVLVIVYLDDILIFSNDKESHKVHIKEVLWHLCKHNLYAKPKKCEFYMTSMEYLGYCLSLKGLTMFPEKVKAIVHWPKPHKIKDIQSFLGFMNFYHWFIHFYSE